MNLKLSRLKLLLFAAALVLGIGGFTLFLKSQLSLDIKRYEQELLGQADSPVEITIPSDETQTTYESPVFKAEATFNAIAPYWKEENVQEGSRQMFFRASENGRTWGEWIEVEGDPMREEDPRPQTIFPEFPLLVEGRFFQYKVVLQREAPDVPAPKIYELNATYIDSLAPPLQRAIAKAKTFLIPASAEGEPQIVSRAGWGNPDPYGQLFRGTDQWWAPTYAPATQIFLHHTVLNNADPPAAVRAIWAYHTYTRGWGDIGYHYLVDQNGTIYEGRAGGDNVVAGHVYTYNSGSLGVAVLGCFETASSSCAGAPPPSPAMVNGLTTLLAWKSTNYEINPNTTQTFCGTSSCLNLWTISGHKDAGITACPGNLVYNLLQTIREQTWNKKNAWQYSAKQLDFDAVSFSEYGTEKAVTIRFKNTGTAAWNNTTNRLLLKTANPDGRTSIFQGTGWIDAQTPAALNEASVALGGTGSFTFKLQSPANSVGYYFENFRLALEGGAALPQVFSLVVLPPSYRWEFLGVSHSKSSVFMAPGETQTINLWAKNTGTATWTQDSSWPVRLGTWGPSRTSSFYHSGWFNNIRPALLNQTSVAPGETGTFTFEVSAPLIQGWHFERFNLVAEGLIWFNDPGAGAYFYVNPPGYNWEFQGVGHSTSSVFMNPGETQTITLKAKNTGTSTWSRDASWPIRLGTWWPSRTSTFYHSGWFNNIRPTKLLEESIAPGAVGTFTFNVFVPAKASPGWYFERVNVVAEGLVWLNYPGAGFYLYVLPGYRWEFRGVSHSTGSVSMNPGETQTITLWAKNTGSTTWYKDASWPVRLGTWSPSRTSSFYHSGWFNNIRPALLNQTSVAPGAVGTFSFTITAPSTKGWYYEKVNLVAEGLVWLNNPGAGFYIYVR